MDLLLYRYRHLTVLLVVIVAQLGLLAFQVRNNQDVRLIRVWAVGAVSPLARVLETSRSGTSNFIDDYFLLLNVREEKRQLETRLGAALLDNQRMRAELETAQRAEALALFQKETPMKTVPARLLMNSTGSASTVYVDVGSSQGIRKGMAVITPNGIAGKVTAVYPSTSMVLLVTDPLFAAGVISQKNRVQGTLRGLGGTAMVDFVQNEQTLDQGEWFYTSGSDFVFPRGLRVGPVTSVKNGLRRKDVQVKPAGFEGGLEQVLVVVEGVHAQIPDAPLDTAPISLQAPPPSEAIESQTAQAAQNGPVTTDADRIVDRNRGKVPSALPPAPAPKP
ncbi:MAG: rod shape-determining protein MreC [Bryobacteraceae bacterium]